MGKFPQGIRPTMTPTTPRSPAYRAEADRVASDSLIEPGDLWRDGATVADTRAPPATWRPDARNSPLKATHFRG